MSIVYIAFVCLLLLSLPVRVSVRRAPMTQIYIRLIFFGMTLTPRGHTDSRKEKQSRPSRKRRLPIPALAYALRYLLLHSVLRVEHVRLPRDAVPSSIALGLLLWGSGALLGAADTVCERLLTTPVKLTEDTAAEGGVTLTFALLTLLCAAIVFLSVYIKRKKSIWRKQT